MIEDENEDEDDRSGKGSTKWRTKWRTKWKTIPSFIRSGVLTSRLFSLVTIACTSDKMREPIGTVSPRGRP